MKHYIVDEATRIWHRPGFDGIDYSDGQEVEDYILSLMTEIADRSVLSDDLRSHIMNWPTEYHLGSSRHCLLRPLNIKAGDRVLELGCGCGAITRYLGEIGADVVAVEGSAQRACITAQRCRDLKNVRVVLDNLLSFDTDQFFDWVLLVGVLEYAPLFIQSSSIHPILQYLEASSAFLSEYGQLVIAIENQIGLKYFNGCSEDHVAQPFFGIQDFYDDHSPVTFGKKELENFLYQSGLNHLVFFYPWPDYKLPTVILHSTAFSMKDLNISNLLFKCISRDYSGSNLRIFSEQFVLPVLERNELLEDLANSFLIVAGKKNQKQHASREEVAWSYACSNRKRMLCTETIFYSNENKAISVEKKRMIDIGVEPFILSSDRKIIHHCGEEKLYQGTLLCRELMKKISMSNSVEETAMAFIPWFEEVFSIARHINGNYKEKLADWFISGQYIDATPFNFICGESKKLFLFDKEWEISDNIPLGWLLYRAIIWGGGVGQTQPYQQSQSVYDIITKISEHAGLTVEEDSLVEWWEMEKSFLSFVQYAPPKEMPKYFCPGTANCFSTIEMMQARINSLELSEQSLKHKIDLLYSSSSWRYSSVIRYLGRYLKGE